MGSSRKRLKRVQESESESEMGSGEENDFVKEGSGEDEGFGGFDDDDDDFYSANGSEMGEANSSSEDEGHANGNDDDDDDDDDDVEEEEEEDKDEDEEDEEEEEEGMVKVIPKDEELEELEKEYRDLRNMEQNLVHTLKRHKDEDIVKGQAIKSQKALWDKALEIRVLMQKAYSKSNKLPQEPIRSLFLESEEAVSLGYSDLIASSKKAIDSIVKLQEALLDNNPSIARATEEGGSSLQSNGQLEKMDVDEQKEWLQISEVQSRVTSFRNKAVDKWQRKADVHSGAAAKKARLLAFNQNISDQVATYMRDPTKMIRGMQMRREAVGVFGAVAQQVGTSNEEGNPEGDPELLDDSDFYQQLLKEFFETIDPSTSETAFYALKKLHTKKRKVVDRRASKSRKIRYHVHEKIVDFMAPQPRNVSEMAPVLFHDLFGLRTQKPTSAA